MHAEARHRKFRLWPADHFIIERIKRATARAPTDLDGDYRDGWLVTSS